MTDQKIQELTLDIAELDAIAGLIKRQRNIDAVSLQKKRYETELSNLRAQLLSQQQQPASSTDSGTVTSTPKRYESEITNYAWDQSEKFVKIFVSIDGVQNATEENVVVTFTSNSVVLKASNIQNKDYKFEIKNFLENIDVEKSYRKIKTNLVAIYAKKANEVTGKRWTHLTSTEKRLADMKESELDPDLEADMDDPTTGLMKIMKNMYEKGDSETKRNIAKAWAVGQEKSKGKDPMEF